MPTAQIHRSDEAAEFIGVAELADHKLDFTRFAKSRQCGVADVVVSSGDSAWGVVWKVSELGMRELDVREGVKYNSYTKRASGCPDQWLGNRMYNLCRRR